MRSSSSAKLRGATLGDMLVFLATLSLGMALLYPAWSARAFRSRVAGAIADVESLRSAARYVLDSDGRWPSAGTPGEAPPELAWVEARDSVFSRMDYTLQWTSWEVVDSVEPPPDLGPAPVDAPPDTVGPRLRPVVRSVGGIAVYSSEDALLAELRQHYADEASFVLDTMWLLVLPSRSDGRMGER